MKTVFLIILFSCYLICIAERNFKIDYDNNQFLKDGKPFKYMSGSLHYFRVPQVLWKDRLSKMRASGVNAVQTVIEWNSHNPEENQYDFTDNRDIVKFIKTAEEVGLSVLVRPGPYTCAERDMGGFPYWLHRVNPHMKLRVNDASYIKEVDKWFSILLPKLAPLMYNRGGPIIMAQIENEYGLYGCDYTYMIHLRDILHKYLGNDTVLYTTDPPSALKCGKVENVFATVDFGPNSDYKAEFKGQREHQEHGPHVNSEYYPGWLDHWEEKHNTGNTKIYCEKLDAMLAMNASVSIYMFHGGTSFGFGSGANVDNGIYLPQPTSYDYDAPLDEAGDPTSKYYEIRKVIGKHFPLPDVPLPKPAPKMELQPIKLTPILTIFDDKNHLTPVKSPHPLTFEELKLRYGFILYSTNITFHPSDPCALSIEGLADRAQIFVDKKYQGTLSRTHKIFSLPINAHYGAELDIFLENQGRVTFGPLIGEFKGMKNAKLGTKVLNNWNHYNYYQNWDEKIKEVENKPHIKEKLNKGTPAFYGGKFELDSSIKTPLDTYLRLDGWTKGIAFLNGFNLGRYWPVSGPQITLYVPAYLFKPHPENNTIVVFEQESSPCMTSDHCTVQFVKVPVINGTIPDHKH